MGLTLSHHVSHTNEHDALLSNVKNALKVKPGLIIKLAKDDPATYAIRCLLEENGMLPEDGVYTYSFKPSQNIWHGRLGDKRCSKNEWSWPWRANT